MRAMLLMLAAFLLMACSQRDDRKPDIEKIERRQNQQMIRMG